MADSMSACYFRRKDAACVCWYLVLYLYLETVVHGVDCWIVVKRFVVKCVVL